jgi:hypothetical protein
VQEESGSKIDQLKRWMAENRTMLKSAGVEIIEATYSGSGDDGCFDGAQSLGENSVLINYKVPAEIETLLEALAAELATPGYEDNDGGGGEIRLIVDTGTITHESYYYSVERSPDKYQEL